MGRCWTWYTSIGGSTRPIPLSPGAKAFGASPVMRWTTYHCWVLLCALKFPLGKYVDRHPRGCGMGVLVLSIVRYFCAAEKQKGVADAMIEAVRYKALIYRSKRTKFC